MIGSFADKETAAIFWRKPAKCSKRLQSAALERLQYLQAANSLDDLRVPAGNRLEKLVGDRKGQYSIRVNKQYRLCFDWNDGVATAVELVDYH